MRTIIKESVCNFAYCKQTINCDILIGDRLIQTICFDTADCGYEVWHHMHQVVGAFRVVRQEFLVFPNALSSPSSAAS